MEFISNTYEYLSPGGIIMIPLVIISVWMWMLVFERLLYFRKIEKNDLNLKQALDIINKQASFRVYEGIHMQIITHFLGERTGDRQVDKKILDRYAMQIIPNIRRSLNVIGILAAVAPLFGLLGTVIGMITTFEVISFFGTGNAKAMAGGISEALVTTQSGLLVAIPGLLMSVFLTRKASRLENRLDEFIMALKRQTA